MFSYLEGIITEKDVSTVTVDVGGVGFLCSASLLTVAKLPETGKKAKVYTYMAVREDAIDLYGFADREELEAFKLLTTVSGVGPKAALAILSQFTYAELAAAVSSGDHKAITRAQGIGPKLAQRVVLELKEKMSVGTGTQQFEGFVRPSAISSKDAEAVEALTVLGYSEAEAKKAVSALNTTDMQVEDVVRIALKTLMR